MTLAEMIAFLHLIFQSWVNLDSDILVRMKWEEEIRDFKNYLRLERGLSENSIEAYIRDITKLSQFCSSEDTEIDITDVTAATITNFLVTLNQLGLAAHSQARIISGIKGFYKYLLIEKKVVDDPTTLVDAPKLGRKLPDTLDLNEINLLLDAINHSKPEGTRNRAIIEVLYSSGLRVSELINLKKSNLFLEAGFIRVIGKGNKERLVPIGSVAIKYLNIYTEEVRIHQDIKPGEEDIVFLNRRGGRLSRVMIFILIKDLVASAGLNKKVSPHTFRHSFATHLIEGGADLRSVQEMLGHESITTTEIYTHLDKSYLKQIIEDFHPRS